MNTTSFTRFPVHKLSITGASGLAMAASLLAGNVSIAATLPIPCAANTCAPANKTPGFTQPGGFVTSGQATATQSGNTLTVNQTSAQAILNWSSFNVSADGKVVFQQPGATSIALNKIYQQSPSSILGQVTANGQIYLLNPNGFVFGAHATVNTAGMIAASLGMTGGDAEFTAGILSQSKLTPAGSALSSDGRIYVTDASGNLVLDAQGKPQPVQIVVQPGAQITAADGGRVMLAGQNVINGGSLSAPDGQVILAAGQSVYLESSSDPSMRGLVVEVGGNTLAGGNTAGTGSATNQVGGVLSAPRGNVTLAGLAVNQSGRISATTAVSANGSVILQAGDYDPNAAQCANAAVMCLNVGGTLKVGATSEIDVLPDLTTTSTAAVGQAQIQSSIKFTGQEVDIEGGTITVPAGNFAVLAAANPDAGLVTNGNSAAQIQVAAGTNINLAGSDAIVPMSENLVSIQLRSNELEDDPDQRGGALQGQTVIVDTRNGKPPIISESSWQSVLQGIQENILQRTSVGGNVSFSSEGSVVVNKGATVNVSGGQWAYQAGVTQTSQLIGANGKAYDISTADPTLLYMGVLNPTYTQTYNGFGIQITQPTPGFGRTQAGYVEGFSAGSVTFAAPALALQGNLLGTAVNGPYQRAAAPSGSLLNYLASNVTGGNGIATGGTLVIGEQVPLSTEGGAVDFFSPGVTFVSNAAPIVVQEGTPLPPQTLQLPVSYITSGGFTQTDIYSDSTVTLPSGLPLNLGAGGVLQVIAPRIAIGSDIQALGGTIDLQNTLTAPFALTGAPRTGIDIESGVTLDVRGQWINDSPLAPNAPVVPTYQDGGQIELALNWAPPKTDNLTITPTGGQLVLGNNVNLEASGGAWVEPTNTLVGGKGGSITLDASAYQSALQIGSGVSLDAFGVQGARGGAFSLAAPRIEVNQGNGTWAVAQTIDDLQKPGVGAFVVSAPLFSQDGFSNVTLTATAPLIPPPATTGSNANVAVNTDVLTVDAGTSISAQSQSWEIQPGYLTRASGGSVAGFSKAQTLPEAARNPFSLTLQVMPAASNENFVSGDLDIQAGARILADPLSNLSLLGEGSVLIDGLLQAPGGTITAEIIPLSASYLNPGYQPGQVIELGSTGSLDVGGTTVLTPNTLNLSLGKVLPGGTIDLVADPGAIVADAGSSINIAGASAILDVQQIGGTGGYSKTTVGSEGGALTVQTVNSESISLLGRISAAAGADSSGKLQGGALTVELGGVAPANAVVNPNPALNSAPTNPPVTIELVSSATGSTPTAPDGNLVSLGVEQLEQSGIDALTLLSSNLILIDLGKDTPLSMGRMISLNAPNIAVSYGGAAILQAPYVELTNTSSVAGVNPTPLAGTASFTVKADQIVLSGVTALQGVGSALLSSTGDVELEPSAKDSSQGAAQGSLALAGNLEIDAARIYPATQTQFTINDPSGNVTIGQTNASPGTPLSAGGTLAINALNITSSGTLLAPFGQIQLTATDNLSLLSGSVTSVSADGATIPYGQTVLNGTQWQYNGTPVNGIPTRQVSLTGGNVSLASGATVDLSGGGDLSAFEWVPGTGGSVDALGQASANAAGLYAIIPSTRNQYASYDLQSFTGSNVGPGQSVYLSGIPGLPAGFYPLLPARYALSFPSSGALLVQVESGYHSQTTGKIGTLTDGTPVVAGYLTFGDTGLQGSSGYIGFAVRPGSYAGNLAQYTLNPASSYFAAAAATAGKTQVTLPADAGTLLVVANSSLSALGSVITTAGKGGSAATIEISADDLTVTATNSPVAGGGVSIGAPILQSWNAGDLILGGQLTADGSGLIVTADNVTIGSGAQFSNGQIIAVANDSVEVKGGANVASTSGAGGTAPKTLPAAVMLNLLHPDSTTTTPDPDSGAAFLAVSDTSLPMVARASGTGSSPGGTVLIDSGAMLSTRGAVSLDAPGAVTVNGTINAAGASWSLASSSIAFVGASGTSTDTLVINPGLLSQMQTAGALQLTSAGSIDLLTNVTLGVGSTSSAPTLGFLGLTAAAINNGSTANNIAAGSSVFGGQTVMLQGLASSSTSPSAPTSGSGSLTFVANTFDIGAAPSSGSSAAPATNLAINGNSQTTLQVNGAVVGQGLVNLGIAGNTTIGATELTAASGAETVISVPDGTLNILQNGTADAPSALASSLGGQLSLSANTILDSGSIIVPGGRISLTAAADPNAANSGGSAQPPSNIMLTGNAVINAGGITVTEEGTTLGAAGGFVTLAATGDLSLSSGSSVNVAGAGEAPAGFLALTGGGTVTLGGSLAGNAASDATGGSFSLDAGQLTGGLAGLAGNLTTGGFTNAIDIRVRNGDLDTAAGTTLTANQITLTADTGSIDIAGTLNAPSAGQRGSIGLFAGNDVTLESTGVLRADGSGSTGRGGEIELSTVSGAISLNTGSVISAGGTAQGGSLLLRAPAIMSDGDVAISAIGSTVNGVAQITIEPVLPTVVSSDGDLGADFNQYVVPLVAQYMTAVKQSGAIAQRFPQPTADSDQPSILLEPGVVIQANGDLSLNQGGDLDLYAMQQGGQLAGPIDLTVRATGNINLSASVSDGVSGTTLSSTPSSSLRFVAGADVTSANPLATVTGSSADLTLGANSPALVRTGTGDIDLVAAHDVNINSGSSAYTTGELGATQAKASNQVQVEFPKSGGNLVVSAGEDVVGMDQTDPQGAGSWLGRGQKAGFGFYGVNLTAFDQDPWSLATFGGGDLSIAAGRDIQSVSAAAADSLSLSGTTQTHFGSGGMTVVAGRDIVTGQFLVADGIGTFNAGRSLATSAATQAGSNAPVGTIFNLEDARLSVWAEGDITIEGILNPTILPQPLQPGTGAFFFTYSADSAFSAQTTSGTMTQINDAVGMGQLLGSAAENFIQGPNAALVSVDPASLSLASLTGDLHVSTGTLFPSVTGQLQLFAGRDIAASNQAIFMSDAPSAVTVTVTNTTGGSGGVIALASPGSVDDFNGDLHVDDATPASIVAGRDITNLQLSIPKAATVMAGRDIVELTYNGQNLNANDITLISAGRDFTDPPTINSNNGLISTSDPSVVSVGGPGQLDILAGRNINLGFSVGVTTTGNLKNPNLPTATGATITMLAGLGPDGPDDAGFLQKIVETSTTNQQQLVAYMEALTGQSNLSNTQADAEFAALPQDQQQQFIDRIFFSELNASGIAANKPGGSYSQGYDAIDALFPNSRTQVPGASPFAGTLNLTYSQVYTLAGGAISLLVPGGDINVGLASPPADATAKPPSQLGIVTQGSGDVSIYSLGDINVESSRVFTLGGGNIVAWSNFGNIDAGNGAKTSLSLPPPTFATDDKGNELLVFNAGVAGSGIRTIQTGPSQPAGNVNLIAPAGAVNAGDAGIGAAGNINIAAVTVTGANNINFGGTATGVPAAVSGITASVSSAASSASSTSNAAQALENTAAKQDAAPLAQTAISWLDVFVTGLGDENCKPEDDECLKRQKKE